MKKIVIILIGLLIAMIASIIYMLVGANKEQPVTQDQPSRFPTSTPITIPSTPDSPPRIPDGEMISIQTENGKILSVNNFFENGVAVPDSMNQGNFYLGNQPPPEDMTPEQIPPYMISFVSSTQYFNVVLYSLPLKKSREAAEGYLANVLGVSKDELCSLNYDVSTPGFVSEEYSGQNLLFSFCPNAIFIPE